MKRYGGPGRDWQLTMRGYLVVGVLISIVFAVILAAENHALTEWRDSLVTSCQNGASK